MRPEKPPANGWLSTLALSASGQKVNILTLAALITPTCFLPGWCTLFNQSLIKRQLRNGDEITSPYDLNRGVPISWQMFSTLLISKEVKFQTLNSGNLVK